jgi:hypothetical protein
MTERYANDHPDMMSAGRDGTAIDAVGTGPAMITATVTCRAGSRPASSSSTGGEPTLHRSGSSAKVTGGPAQSTWKTASRIRVRIADTASEPRHPRRLEKNRNIPDELLPVITATAHAPTRDEGMVALIPSPQSR